MNRKVMIHTVQVFGADQLAHTILFWGKTKVKQSI